MNEDYEIMESNVIPFPKPYVESYFEPFTSDPVTTMSDLKTLISKFPDNVPVELWVHAPNYSDIEIDVKIRTLGRTKESDFE